MLPSVSCSAKPTTTVSTAGTASSAVTSILKNVRSTTITTSDHKSHREQIPEDGREMFAAAMGRGVGQFQPDADYAPQEQDYRGGIQQVDKPGMAEHRGHDVDHQPHPSHRDRPRPQIAAAMAQRQRIEHRDDRRYRLDKRARIEGQTSRPSSDWSWVI